MATAKASQPSEKLCPNTGVAAAAPRAVFTVTPHLTTSHRWVLPAAISLAQLTNNANYLWRAVSVAYDAKNPMCCIYATLLGHMISNT
jgi:hypothetical protein